VWNWCSTVLKLYTLFQYTWVQKVCIRCKDMHYYAPDARRWCCLTSAVSLFDVSLSVAYIRRGLSREQRRLEPYVTCDSVTRIPLSRSKDQRSRSQGLENIVAHSLFSKYSHINKLGGRPQQFAPAPCKLTFDLCRFYCSAHRSCGYFRYVLTVCKYHLRFFGPYRPI